jgi:pyrroline-5-carboxylate reductase
MESTMRKARIAFIGAGNMNRSLIAGLVKDAYPAEQLWVYDHHPEKCQFLNQLYGLHIAKSNADAVQHADIVILGVKPFSIASVAQEVGKMVAEKKPLLISIAAGVKTQELAYLFGEKTAVVRVMPNTPALIGCGAAGMFANENTSVAQKNLAEQILRAVGITIWISKESKMDVVTALSGSGPAYAFALMEAMEQAAIDMGLSEQSAHLLTLQTVYGAARMALESKEPLSRLREQVTSKGGTTEAALKALSQHQFNEVIAKAIHAAKDRGVEISESLNTRKQLGNQK